VPNLLQVLLLGTLLQTTGRRIRVLAVQPNVEHMLHVAELCEQGKLAPVIDARYSLNEVPEALRSLGEGRSKGKVVVVMGNTGEGPE
jgi:NADPH:quinone reductase-like Zn-dependent oxidoreductase